MIESSVLITLSVCLTVMVLAALAYQFDWSKLRADPSKDLQRRVDAYQDDVVALRRATVSSLDEHDRRLAKLDHEYETQRERFDAQIAEVKEERSRYVQMNRGRLG